MAVTIDKETFTLSHKPTPDVVVECLSALLSCYCGFLNFTHCTGKVTAEKVGRREEKALGDAYQLIYNNGTPILSVAEVRQALTSKKLHIKPKSQNIAGLQIADLFAYPVTQEILQENNRSVPSISDFNKLILAATSAKYNMKQKHNRLYCYGKFLIT